VQEREVRGIECAFHRLRPVALLQALGDEAMRRRQRTDLEPGQRLRHSLARAKVGPDHLAGFAGRVCRDRDLAVVGRIRRHVGHLDAFAVGVVLPAVVNAAQAALLVAAEEKVGAAMCTRGLDQPDATLRVAERDQALAHHLHADRRTVRFRQLARQRHRQPEAPEVLAHRAAGTGAHQQLVLCAAQHDWPIIGLES
jgi:hypothetical protein